MAGDVVPSIRRAAPEVDEGPSEEDIERFGGVTQRCPECGTELYDDVVTCWNCGAHVGVGSGGSSVSARWAVAVIVLLILAFVLYAVL